MRDAMKRGALGIGVIDTTSLWAASTLIHQPERNDTGDPADLLEHPLRELNATNRDYFLSLLHTLLLYEEIRTDFHVLEDEGHWYRHPVNKLVSTLSQDMRVVSIPHTIKDDDLIRSVLPAFVERTHRQLSGRSISGSIQQLYAVAQRPSYGSITEMSLLQLIGRDGVSELEKLLPAAAQVNIPVANSASLLAALGRQVSILARTIRYCAHSNHIEKVEGVPSAFCASPRRIEILADYVQHKELNKLTFGTTGFLDLLSKLGLPSSGYDFSTFSNDIKPLNLSDLSRSVEHLSHSEALARVLELRRTEEGQELRAIWAERLWAGESQAVEGIGMSMQNVTAGGDVLQVIVGRPHEHARSMTTSYPRAESYSAPFGLAAIKRALGLGQRRRTDDAKGLRHWMIEQLSAR